MGRAATVLNNEIAAAEDEEGAKKPEPESELKQGDIAAAKHRG